MKPTTRSRILDHLRKNQIASVSELSRLMGMTGANIRHHLAILEFSGQIEIVNKRKAGRGRPEQLYALSRHLLGDGMEKLVGTLFDVWLDGASDQALEAIMKSVAQRLAGEPDGTVPGTQRLLRTVERLNELHYQARWEAGAKGPRLILGHCPFTMIIAGHPELCRMDAFLIEKRLGLPVEQIVKLQSNDRTLPFCIFLVMKPW